MEGGPGVSSRDFLNKASLIFFFVQLVENVFKKIKKNMT